MNAKLLMQVHDEIVLEVPACQAERAGRLLVQAMLEAGQYFLEEMPVEVEAVICENWSGKNARPVPTEELQPAIEITPQPTFPHQSDLKELAKSVRNLDLLAVATSLGLERDRTDKSKWIAWAETEGDREKQHVISITDNKFMDWKTEEGGIGAVSLTMAVQECDFRTAVEWLSRQSLPVQTVTESKEPRSLELPPPNPANWEAVQKYLTETLALPVVWVDKLHQQGLVYADDRRNAVFLRQTFADSKTWDRLETTGATLRGSVGDFKGLAPGSSRDNGWFWIGVGRGEVQRVVVTESPIDTLSLAALATGQPH